VAHCAVSTDAQTRSSSSRKIAFEPCDINPVDVAQVFEAAGACMLHIVDLDAAFSLSNQRNLEVLSKIIRAVDIPVQFEGCLRGR
jgi:phosphoribosylformimino-5-aminoimidazole carboxamide ribonucleotide (ProFAR) isomerase